MSVHDVRILQIHDLTNAVAHGSENRRGHVVQSASLSVLDVDVLVQRFQKVVIQH